MEKSKHWKLSFSSAWSSGILVGRSHSRQKPRARISNSSLMRNNADIFDVGLSLDWKNLPSRRDAHVWIVMSPCLREISVAAILLLKL